jgi:hypothetical protein
MAWQVKISDNATVTDTVNLIRKTVLEYAHSPVVTRLVAKLKKESQTDEQFFKKLFSFACRNVEYKRDEPGHEKVTTPERLLRDGVGDCKKFTTLIGAALVNAGYKPILKIVSYNNKTWAHIYIIVPVKGERKYIVLDPVNKCQYDKEVNHKKSWIHNLNGENMELSLLGKLDKSSSSTGLQKNQMFQNLRNNPKFMRMCANQYKSFQRLKDAGGLKNIAVTSVAGDLLNQMSEISGESPSELMGEYSELMGGEDYSNSLLGLSGAEEYQFQSLLGYAPDSLAAEELLFGVYANDDLGRAKKGKKKKRKGKIWGFLKKVGLAPSRIAFLGMVRINLFGLAKKLYLSIKKDKGVRLKKLWKKLGGNYKKLLKAIEGGVKRLKRKGKLKGLNEFEAELTGISGLGAAPLAAIAAIAVPIITAAMSLFKKQGVVDKNNPEDVATVQAVDKAEANLEQKIDSGQAEQIVETVQADPQVQRALANDAAQQQQDVAESYESDDAAQQQQDVAESYESDVEKSNMDLSGLGDIDWGNLLNTVSSVVKAVKPAVKPAVAAVKQIKQAAKAAKNPKTKAYLNNQASKATTALKSATAPGATGIQKKTAGQQVVSILNDVSESINGSLNNPLQKNVGSFSGGSLCHKILKIGALIGTVQTFYGNTILNFITNLF